jgi:hypothetical protein
MKPEPPVTRTFAMVLLITKPFATHARKWFDRAPQ